MRRTVWRSFTRSPGFTAAAVLTLALGIGANTAMFSVIDGVLLKPLAYSQPDRLVSLHIRITTLRNLGVLPLPPFIYQFWRDRASTLENIAVVRPDQHTFTVGGRDPQILLSARVSSSFFSTLGVTTAIGRPFLPKEEPNPSPRVAILSDGFWRKRFAADPKIVGRTIQLDGGASQVIGVMPHGFELPIDLETQHASRFDVLLPLDLPPDQLQNHGYWGVARLKPGVTVERARAELDALLASRQGDLTRNAVIAPLPTNLSDRVQRGLSLLMVAVALVLLIACGNLANLLLSRGLARRKEIAVRAALGAGRWQILRQLFGESLALALVGGICGALCSGWILAAILSQVPQELPHRPAIAIDARALAFTSSATLLCALLFAALPAWRFSNADPQDSLRQTSRGATGAPGSEILRRCLVASQVMLCTMLLIASGLLLRSFAKIWSVDRGFQTENVITAEIPLNGSRYASPPRRSAIYRDIEDRLAAIPGVSASGSVNALPLSGDDYQGPVFLPGFRATPDSIANLPIAQLRYATPGYFPAAGIPLRSGRIFSAAPADTMMALVSSTAARRLWPDRDPIGQQFTIEESPNPRIWTVAGVVADVRQNGLQSPPAPMVYVRESLNRDAGLSFVLRTTLPFDSAARAIRNAVLQVDPTVPVASIRPMSEIVAASAAQRRFQTLVLACFAAVAVLLAALGIYATVAYAVNQRLREIGIRLALGAQRRHLGAMVARQALTPVGWGLAAGGAGAFLLMRALQALLFGVGSADALTYAASIALIFALAAAACWLPARRAMRLDPVETIRAE